MTTKKDEEKTETKKTTKKGPELNEQPADLGTLAKEQRELDEEIRRSRNG